MSEIESTTTGQRLVAWTNLGNSVVHIHALGCADTSKKMYKKADQIDDGSVEWTSKEAWGADHWSDINAEMEADGQPLYDWQDSELKFFPCVTVRDWEPTKDEETEMAKADTKSESKELPGKAPNEVPAPRSPKSKALPGGKCRCGCGKEVGRTSTFAQGHDARFVSQLLVQVNDGKLTKVKALAEAKSISDPLEVKLQKALDNADKTATAKEQAAKDKAEKAKKAAELKEAAKAKAAADKAAKAKATEEAKAEQAVTDVEGDEDELDSDEGDLEEDTEEDDDF